MVVWPGDRGPLRAGCRTPRMPRCVSFPSPSRGAMATPSICAREFTGDDAFLHMVGDHLYVTARTEPCAQRLVELAEAEECSVSGVQPTRESLLPRFGAVAGRRVARPQRPLSHRYRHRKAHSHRSRAAPDGARHSRRLLPLLLRHPRAHARGDGTARNRRAAPDALRRAGRTGAPRAVPGAGRHRPPLRPRRALRPADRATGAGPQRAATAHEVLAQMVELLADREARAAAGGDRQ